MMPNIDALLSRAGSLGMLGLLGLGVIVVLLFSFELGCVFFSGFGTCTGGDAFRVAKPRRAGS